MPHFADLDRLRADLDALRPLAPEQEARVLQKFRLEWNYNSNAIEGNSLTLGETRSLLLHGLTAAGKPMRDHLDIKGHNEAVVALEEFVRSEYPLTEQFIREMHQVLLGREPYYVEARTAAGQLTRKLITPGQYKTSGNQVETTTGETLYFASPEETPGRMTDLVDWYRTEEAAPTLPPVALAAEFHYRFVRIHPFDDGNGRMSRLLMNLILLRHGYPMTVIQAADRNHYLAALAEADAGEPEPFLRFILENVEASLHLMIRAARGESIDEPSDLDKKLALLKKQLDAPAIKNVSNWNYETQQHFTYLIIKPWIDDLESHINRFDFLFENRYIRIQGYRFINKYLVRQLSSVKENINDAINLLNRELQSKILFDNISVKFTWRSFKNIINFDLDLAFAFAYGKDNYQIIIKINDEVVDYALSHTNAGHIYTGSYNKAIYMPDVVALNNEIANKVYDFIAAKLAGADTPPA